MKTVIVREIPASDLTVTFAKENENGKFDRYAIAYQYILARYPGVDPQKAATLMLEAHFKKTLGADTELIVELSDYTIGAPRKSIALDESIFTKASIKALNQVKVAGTLYQYLMNFSPFPDVIANLLDRAGIIINRLLLRPINTLLHTAYGLNPVRQAAMWPTLSDDADIEPALSSVLESADAYFNEKYNTKYQEYLDLVDSKFFLPLLIESRFARSVTPVTYIAVACGEDDLGEAIEAVSKDLDLMARLGLIMGNLNLPILVELANVVGNGKKVYAVYVSPILNTQQLVKISNVASVLDLSPCGMKEMKSLGISNLVYEGGVNFLNGKEPYADLVGEDIKIEDEVGVIIEDDKAELKRLYEQMNADNARVRAKLEATKAAQQKQQNDGDKA